MSRWYSCCNRRRFPANARMLCSIRRRERRQIACGVEEKPQRRLPSVYALGATNPIPTVGLFVRALGEFRLRTLFGDVFTRHQANLARKPASVYSTPVSLPACVTRRVWCLNGVVWHKNHRVASRMKHSVPPRKRDRIVWHKTIGQRPERSALHRPGNAKAEAF